MNIFVVLFSHTTGSNNAIREIDCACTTKEKAVEIILDNISKMFEFDEGPKEGKKILCDNDVVALDDEKTSHNGGVLKLTVPIEEFNGIRYYDDANCPEWVWEWEIEEIPLVGDLKTNN